jgi:hypothetical protein
MWGRSKIISAQNNLLWSPPSPSQCPTSLSFGPEKCGAVLPCSWCSFQDRGPPPVCSACYLEVHSRSSWNSPGCLGATSQTECPNTSGFSMGGRVHAAIWDKQRASQNSCNFSSAQSCCLHSSWGLILQAFPAKLPVLQSSSQIVSRNISGKPDSTTWFWLPPGPCYHGDLYFSRSWYVQFCPSFIISLILLMEKQAQKRGGTTGPISPMPLVAEPTRKTQPLENV